MVRSEITFRGHAVHPIAVTLPLGAIPTAIVFDVLHVWTRAEAWSLAAFVATLLGTVGIIGASIPGMVDYMRIVPQEGKAWKRATAHMALGWVLGGYYVAFSFARFFALPAPPWWGAWVLLVANLAGFGLMMVQGYWGGELVEKHRLGVHEDEAVERQARASSRRGPTSGGGGLR